MKLLVTSYYQYILFCMIYFNQSHYPRYQFSRFYFLLVQKNFYIFQCFPPNTFKWSFKVICQIFYYKLVVVSAWEVFKYGVFSGPHFLAFGLTTERYSIYLCIQFEGEKIRTRKISVFGHFSRSANFGPLWKTTGISLSTLNFILQILCASPLY